MSCLSDVAKHISPSPKIKMLWAATTPWLATSGDGHVHVVTRCDVPVFPRSRALRPSCTPSAGRSLWPLSSAPEDGSVCEPRHTGWGRESPRTGTSSHCRICPSCCWAEQPPPDDTFVGVSKNLSTKQCVPRTRCFKKVLSLYSMVQPTLVLLNTFIVQKPSVNMTTLTMRVFCPTNFWRALRSLSDWSSYSTLKEAPAAYKSSYIQTICQLISHICS